MSLVSLRNYTWYMIEQAADDENDVLMTIIILAWGIRKGRRGKEVTFLNQPYGTMNIKLYFS